MAIEFDEFRKAISSAAKLADEIDNGEVRNIRCMEIYVIDLLSQIAENITYSEWADRDEKVMQEEIITELDGFKHELIKHLMRRNKC